MRSPVIASAHGIAKIMFCRHCGVKSFYQPRSHPEPEWSVNAHCLDAAVELAIEAFDGRNWEASAAKSTQASSTDAEPCTAHEPSARSLGSSRPTGRWGSRTAQASRGRNGGEGGRLRPRRAQKRTEALIEAEYLGLLRLDLGKKAEALGNFTQQGHLVVLHGVGPGDAEAALRLPARPCLNSIEQVRLSQRVRPNARAT